MDKAKREELLWLLDKLRWSDLDGDHSEVLLCGRELLIGLAELMLEENGGCQQH